MRIRVLLAAVVLCAPLAVLAPASAARASPAKSCNTSMTGEAYPNQGNYAQIIVDANSCGRLLRAVAYCWNGHDNYYVDSASITSVGAFAIVYCHAPDSLQGSGCQEHYGSGWSAIFLRWINGNHSPNPYPCP
jgi:hypothetical protein